MFHYRYSLTIKGNSMPVYLDLSWKSLTSVPPSALIPVARYDNGWRKHNCCKRYSPYIWYSTDLTNNFRSNLYSFAWIQKFIL